MTPPQTMIERVARALCAAGLGESDMPTDRLRAIVEANWTTFEPDARAAIDAMFLPTEAQLIAARDWSAKKYGRPIGNDAAEGCWSAMISAALTEGGQT